MKISKLYTTDLHDAGSEVEVLDDQGAKTGLFITVVGVDSTVFRAQAKKQQRAYIESLRGKKDFDDEAFATDSLVAATIGWRGTDEKFTKKLCKELYTQAPYIKDQIDLFNTYKGTCPGIFAIFDEDSANLLINRHNLQKCLPLIDIEEISSVDMNIFHNYKYGAHPVSPNVILPQHENDLLIFHGFKTPEFEEALNKEYLQTVLFQDDFLVKFKDNKFWWVKNSFLVDKNIQPIVRFEVLYKNQVIYTLSNQPIWDYWAFYIEDFEVSSGYYDMRIVEEESNRIIYKNTIKI